MTAIVEKHQTSESESEVEDEKTPLISKSNESPGSSRSSSPEPPPETTDRFEQPQPSPFKRAALLLFIAFLFWLGYSMRARILEAKRNPKVIHASRYSKEYKFRPAASPIITETLKDGRVRLRGAQPAPTATPTPTPKVKKTKKKKTGAGKLSGKKKSGSRKPKTKPAGKRF